MNKFAAKSCTRFPPHLNNVSALLRNLRCSSRTCCHWVVRKTNSIIYPTTAVSSTFARFESSWLQRVGILQEMMYKTRITDLGELKQRLRTEWAMLDHVVITAATHQWRRCLSVCVKAGGGHSEHLLWFSSLYCQWFFVADVDDINS